MKLACPKGVEVPALEDPNKPPEGAAVLSLAEAPKALVEPEPEVPKEGPDVPNAGVEVPLLLREPNPRGLEAPEPKLKAGGLEASPEVLDVEGAPKLKAGGFRASPEVLEVDGFPKLKAGGFCGSLLEPNIS